jgi:alpha-ribazole phosphatase
LAIGECWDVIDPDELNPWMADFVTIRVLMENHLPIYTVVLSILYKVNSKYAFETSDYCSSPGMSEAFLCHISALPLKMLLK